MLRPSWTNYFLCLAKLASCRSHDIHTKHGCVITDFNNRILGVGYNGFPRSLPDSELPTTRPEKYAWMVHAERNALANCTQRPENGIAYVTGQCCNDCTISLWQAGVKEIFMINGHGTHLFDEPQQKFFSDFVKHSKIKIHYIDPDFSWLKKLDGVI